MSSPVYTSIIETTRLELQGAEHRLDVARRVYRTFVEEHGRLTDDGQVIYIPTPTREMLLSLEHERDSLETEIDESLRRVAHCNEVIADMQLCAAVETDTVADLILGFPQTDEGDGAVEENRK
jgi:hypothetical protein